MNRFFDFFRKQNIPKQPSFSKETVMDKTLVDEYNAKRNIQNHSSFCYAPSVNMYFSQTGEVKVCCHNTTYTIGTYPQQSIGEIWNSKKAVTLREQMQRYDLRTGCNACAFDVQLKAYQQVQARHFDARPRHLDYPTMMEFLLSNKCNLECIMCVGEYSSLIRKSREQLPPLQFPYDIAFLDQLEEFIPHLHEARFSGSGEAFLIDINYEIWEKIILLNPKCVITVQTNGMILTDKVKRILEKGNFQIGVSIDSIQKEIYEAIRPNAQFEKVMENIRYFSEYSSKRNRYFMLALCVMRQNVDELPAFIELCNSLNAAAVLHKVWSPDQYSLQHLSAETLWHIQHRLSGFSFTPSNALQEQNLAHYHYFLDVIKHWATAADVKEATLVHLADLSESQLLEFVCDQVKQHLDSLNQSAEDRKELFARFEEKLKQVILQFDKQERWIVLQKVYLEKPANVMAPMLNTPVAVLVENARKSMFSK